MRSYGKSLKPGRDCRPRCARRCLLSSEQEERKAATAPAQEGGRREAHPRLGISQGRAVAHNQACMLVNLSWPRERYPPWEGAARVQRSYPRSLQQDTRRHCGERPRKSTEYVQANAFRAPAFLPGSSPCTRARVPQTRTAAGKQ